MMPYDLQSLLDAAKKQNEAKSYTQQLMAQLTQAPQEIQATESPELQMLRQRLSQPTHLDKMGQMSPLDVKNMLWEQEYGPRAKGKLRRFGQDAVIGLAEALGGHKRPDFSRGANDFYLKIQEMGRREDVEKEKRYAELIKSHNYTQGAAQRHRAAMTAIQGKDLATAGKLVGELYKSDIQQGQLKLAQDKFQALDANAKEKLKIEAQKLYGNPMLMSQKLATMNPEDRAMFMTAFQQIENTKGLAKAIPALAVASTKMPSTSTSVKAGDEENLGLDVNNNPVMRQKAPIVTSTTRTPGVNQGAAGGLLNQILGMPGGQGYQGTQPPQITPGIPQSTQPPARQPGLPQGGAMTPPRPTQKVLSQVAGQPVMAPSQVAYGERLKPLDGRLPRIVPKTGDAKTRFDKEREAIKHTIDIGNTAVDMYVENTVDDILGALKNPATFGEQTIKQWMGGGAGISLGPFHIGSGVKNAPPGSEGVSEMQWKRAMDNFKDKPTHKYHAQTIHDKLQKVTSADVFATSGASAAEGERAYIKGPLPSITNAPDEFLSNAVRTSLSRQAFAKSLDLNMNSDEYGLTSEKVLKTVESEVNRVVNAAKELKRLKMSGTANQGEIARLKAMTKMPSGEELLWRAIQETPELRGRFSFSEPTPVEKAKKLFNDVSEEDIFNKLTKKKVRR